MTSKMSQEAKKDEFKKYLEKAGVLELLTKSLVQLYEEPDKPTDALNYLKNTVGGTSEDQQVIGNLRTENADLRAKLKEMEANQSALEAQIAALEAAGGDSEDVPMAESVETPAAPAAEAQVADLQKEEEEKAEVMETDDSATETKPEPSATADTPVEQKDDAPTEAPAETPDEASAKAPSEAPVEDPAEPAAAVPTEAPVDAPAEAPTPAEPAAAVPAEAPVDAPAEAAAPATFTAFETAQPQGMMDGIDG